MKSLNHYDKEKNIFLRKKNRKNRHENCCRHGRRACGTIIPQVRNQNVKIPRIVVTNLVSYLTESIEILILNVDTTSFFGTA